MDYDKHLKNIWVRRILAALIDFFITIAIVIIFDEFIIHLTYLYLSIMQGVVWYFYSSIFDAINGKTPGKYLFKIRAVAFIGDLSISRAFLRNLTKLNVILVIADAVAGLSTEGDPRQRYTERVIDSLVISEQKIERKIIEFTGKPDKNEELVLPKQLQVKKI